MYHSYFVASLQISLDVEVRPGNEHAGAKGLPGLWQTPGKLPAAKLIESSRPWVLPRHGEVQPSAI